MIAMSIPVTTLVSAAWPSAASEDRNTKLIGRFRRPASSAGVRGRQDRNPHNPHFQSAAVGQRWPSAASEDRNTNYRAVVSVLRDMQRCASAAGADRNRVRNRARASCTPGQRWPPAARGIATRASPARRSGR
ncbi:hypothetical protein ACIRSS_24035 [Amycolatopsis sp. NPDC101161]|uniref:hypothetical protein n=1 Tax=Amycolatopsis sp. NPDC101161 TaxID=3363940 RepID=UPI003813C026